MRVRTHWIFVGILAILLIMAQRVLWLSHDGFPADFALKEKIHAQLKRNRRLDQLNDRLYSEVTSLEHGTGAVEQHARTDLDFVKPGETFYEVVQPQSRSTPSKEAAGTPQPLASRSPRRMR